MTRRAAAPWAALSTAPQSRDVPGLTYCSITLLFMHDRVPGRQGDGPGKCSKQRKPNIDGRMGNRCSKSNSGGGGAQVHSMQVSVYRAVSHSGRL